MGPIIDITNLFPYRIIMLFAYSFACYNIAHSVLKDKFNSFITLIAIFIARIVTSVAFFNRESIDALGYPAFAILLFVTLTFLTVGKISYRIICIVFSFISQFLSNFITAFMQAIAYQGKEYAEVFGTNNPNLYHLYIFLASAIIMIAVSFLFSSILKLFNTRKSSLSNKKIYAYISFLPFSHILIFVFPLILVPTDYEATHNFIYTTDLPVFIMISVILLFDCAFPFVIDHFEKVEKQNIQNEKELMKNKLDYQQMQMLKEEKQEFRKLRHDYLNIISTAKGFIEIDKPEKALSLFQNISDDLTGLSGFSVCSNETINTIFYTKIQQAKNFGVNLTVNINENFGVLIDEYDLCRILCNLIDNSLNAAKESENNKICDFNITINEENVVIDSKNSFKSTKQKKFDKSGLHGNGIGIIKEITSKYDSTYSSKQENSVWYTNILLNNRAANKATPPEFLTEFKFHIIKTGLRIDLRSPVFIFK